MARIETERLTLRLPEPRDRAALHAMWADPLVMADLGPVKTADDSDAALARHAEYGAAGLGFQAVERRDTGETIGFCGLKPGAEDTPIKGELEIGWMIGRAHWRQGFACEAAAAFVDWAWVHRAETRIVAITAACNAASRSLMTRLGMRYLPALDFAHPIYPEDSPLRDTVVYAINRPA